ncbi:hypothetical protein [Spirillospora sp. NPDC048819]|uniref:hypothetical protein n=1 Tax=Spirillospora sp. NPDC048819 TaxID=3155268 RepID=UPI0033FDDC8A
MLVPKCCDIDIVNRTVRVRGAYIERANGQMILGPTKSRAGLRTVAIPDAIVPHLVAHLTKYTKKGDDALVFTGIKSGTLRCSGFNNHALPASSRSMTRFRAAWVTHDAVG